MIAIFVKELRECAKWGLVIFGALAVLVYLQVRSASPLLLYQLPEPTTILFAPIAGLLLGLVQTLFETRPDNWAFVVHRPIARGAVFAGKCAAGLLVLYAALELPCLLAVAWAARPGNLPVPFQARAVLPTLADVLNAGCYYFAGMVLTLRKARWSGTRLLPLGFAVACTVLVRILPHFWQAMAVVAAGHAVGTAAAWGAFATNGAMDEGRGSRASLGAMVWAGALCVGCAAVGLVGLLFTRTSWQQERMDREGNMVLIRWSMNQEQRTAAVTDLEGRPLPQYASADVDDPAYGAERFVQPGGYLVDDRLFAGLDESELRGYRSITAGVIRLSAVAKPGARVPFICLYDVRERVIRLYDLASRVQMGTVGPAGFTAGRGEPAEDEGHRFAGRVLNPLQQTKTHAMAFESAVYWIEMDHRRVRKLFTAPGDDPVISAQEAGPATDPVAIIATKRMLHVVRAATGEAVFSTPSVVDLGQYMMWPVVLPGNHHIAMWAGAVLPEWSKQCPSQVVEFNERGALVRRTRLPVVSDPQAQAAARAGVFGAVCPAAALPLYFGWHRGYGMDYTFDMDTHTFGWLFWGCMIGAAVVSAAGTMVLARRFGFKWPATAAWTAAGAVLGLAGLAVVTAIHEWPAREACAACGRWRIVSRRACARCGSTAMQAATAATAAQAAEPNGREIFEPMGAFQTV